MDMAASAMPRRVTDTPHPAMGTRLTGIHLSEGMSVTGIPHRQKVTVLSSTDTLIVATPDMVTREAIPAATDTHHLATAVASESRRRTSG